VATYAAVVVVGAVVALWRRQRARAPGATEPSD
jgi:hypothetical protein